MTVQETLQEWDFFDQGISRHGFTAYNRDYRVEVNFSGWDRVVHPVTYLFRGCVEAHYLNLVVPNVYPTFMDDRFIDYQQWEAADCPEGFVWGVNEADAYPGWKYIEDSERASAWAEKLNLPMHEIEIETNTYRLTLVFHDLTVQSPSVTAPDEHV